MCVEAPNVNTAKRTVLANRAILTLSGTCGDRRHLAGGGDHTPYSTHRGKYGYPTRGQVHAIDISASRATLTKFENWIRNEIRYGRLKGLKYFNVLGRHWNMQTWVNYNSMKGGRARPTKSSDVHLHLSFENGSIDANLVARYVAFHYGRRPVVPARPATPPRRPTVPINTTSQGDDMTPAELLNYKVWSPALYTGGRSVGDLMKYGYAASAKAELGNKKIDALKVELASLKADIAAIKAAVTAPAATTATTPPPAPPAA